MKDVVLQVLRVKCLDNPEKYLGLPNVMGKNKLRSFQGLKDRIMERINNWCMRVL